MSDPVTSSTPVDVPPPPPPALGDTPPPEESSKKRNRSSARNIIEWVAIIAAALVVAIVIKTFLFQAFYIPSESMEPTLKPQDRVLVNKLSYKLHPIHRGDIVVFKRPPSEAGDPTIKDLIKRVVGLPGETIEIHTAGGGGYGDARERDPDQIARDLELGYVTEGEA